MKTLKDIIYYILSIQEKILRLQLSRTIGAKDLSKRKRTYTNGCFLDLNTLADSQKQKLFYRIQKHKRDKVNLSNDDTQKKTQCRIDTGIIRELLQSQQKMEAR